MYFRGYCPVPALVCVVDTGVFVHNFLNCFLVVFGTLSSVSGAKAFVEEVIHLRIIVAACVGGSVDGLGTEELSKETVRIRIAVPAYAVAVTVSACQESTTVADQSAIVEDLISSVTPIWLQ